MRNDRPADIAAGRWGRRRAARRAPCPAGTRPQRGPLRPSQVGRAVRAPTGGKAVDMPSVTRSRTVAAPVEQVWALVSDPFHLPRWWPATARVEDVEDDAWTSVLKTPGGKSVRADFTRVERRPQ